MENSISVTPIATPNVTQVTNDRESKINRYLSNSEKFTNDTKPKIDIEPNVPVLVLFHEDWYVSYDDLLDEAIKVKKMETLDASTYAERGYRVKEKIEKDPESEREYPVKTYRVTLPNSSYPNMDRFLQLSSRKAIEAIDEQLRKVSIDQGHTGKILMKINKKGGKTRFDVKWEIEGSPFPSTPT